MHAIYYFKAWEVRNIILQTVHDLDLKRRSYVHLKTHCTKVQNSFQRANSSAKISLLLDTILKYFMELKLCI